MHNKQENEEIEIRFRALQTWKVLYLQLSCFRITKKQIHFSGS